jgi:hypothetical protein
VRDCAIHALIGLKPDLHLLLAGSGSMQRAFQGRCRSHNSSHVYHRQLRLTHAFSIRHAAALRQSNKLRNHAHSTTQCRRRPAAAAAAADSNSNVQIGAELLAGRADAKAAMQWREATVLENRCSIRLTALLIEGEC